MPNVHLLWGVHMDKRDGRVPSSCASIEPFISNSDRTVAYVYTLTRGDYDHCPPNQLDYYSRSNSLTPSTFPWLHPTAERKVCMWLHGCYSNWQHTSRHEYLETYGDIACVEPIAAWSYTSLVPRLPTFFNCVFHTASDDTSLGRPGYEANHIHVHTSVCIDTDQQ